MLQWLKSALGGVRGSAPREVDAWTREAYALHCAGELARAEEIYRRILAREPRHADAQYLLGEIATLRGDHRGAATLIRGAIAANAGEPQFHYALGCALQGGGDVQGATGAYREALALDGAQVGAHLNLGSLLQEQAEVRAGALTPQELQRDLDEAIAHFESATRLAPGNTDAWMNLGYAMERRRDLAQALRFYDHALAIDPAMAQARFNRAMVLLALGRMREGWDEYEWRWEASGYPRPEFPQPQWDGRPLEGRTLLLYTEQGFGDAIQFARYAALAAARGARVIVRSLPELVTLMAAVPGVSQAMSAAQPLPQFDTHCALLSLPRVLAMADAVPAWSAYVRVDERAREAWRARVPPAGGMKKIGLAWASQPQNRIAPLKSASLEALKPLAHVRGARFYSLQKGAAAAREADPTGGLPMMDLAPHLHDFAQTAAAIENLDLVITVDTAVAHLAGALGKPVWTLLPYVRDWRWHPQEEATSWYPSMRLYAQAQRGDWTEIVERVARELESFCVGRATSPT